MLILLIALPLLTGLAAALPFPSRRGRLTFLLTMQIIETALVVWTLVSGRSYTTNIWHLTESLTIAMKLDGVAAVFSALTAVAWLLALIYSVEYMSHSQNEARVLCVPLSVGGDAAGDGFVGRLRIYVRLLRAHQSLLHAAGAP